MTEEENKAIEDLKEALKDIKDYLNSSNNTEEGIKLSTAIKVTSLGVAIENVLYLVEKKTDELIKTYNEEIKDNYIPKSKIREKIEELEKQLADNAKELNELRRTIMENQPEKKVRIAGLRMDNLKNYKMIRFLKQLLEEE